MSDTWHTDGQMQLSHMTSLNRFPKIMESAKRLKPNAKRILSFGCSSGEEVQTLAEHFPKAQIIGVDIDYWSVNKARKENKHKGRVFYHTEVGGTGRYDLVTCFMVLFSLTSEIPRDKWEEVVQMIDGAINASGVLMIYTSDYDFMTSAVAEKYRVIKSWKRKHTKNDKKYFCGYYRKSSRLIDHAKLVVC